MKAFIPELGSELKVEKDWTFELYLEHRNSDVALADGRNTSYSWQNELDSYSRTLPAGTKLEVDRIYVRKGLKEFSSVTLKIIETTDQALVKAKGNRNNYGRFWVKLADFNYANFTVVNDTSISAEAQEDHSEPATLAMIKRRNGYGQKYWVKFEHEDPELSYEGPLQVRKLKEVQKMDPSYNPGFPHTVTSGPVGPGWNGQRLYRYMPKYFFESLVADSWKEARENDSRYKVTVPNPFYYVFGMFAGYDMQGSRDKTMIVTKHPLEDKIHIPTDKDERLPLGIKTDKTELIDIPIAGGKLSIYDIKLV